MEIKSKILKIHNLPNNMKCIDYLNSKPYFILLCLIAIGILLSILKLYLIGALFIVVGACCLLFVRNIRLIEFFEPYAVFYLNNGKNECFILFWEDVEKYEFITQQKDLDILAITLKNKREISLRCLGKKKIMKNFDQHVQKISMRKTQ